MAAPAGNLETLGRGLLKLLPCVAREAAMTAAELIHRMHSNTAIFRELSTSGRVYPGVGQWCFGDGGSYTNVE